MSILSPGSPSPPAPSHHIFLGVDPGKTGALAALYPDGHWQIAPMPGTDQDVLHWLRNVRETEIGWGRVHSVIEQIDPRPTTVFDKTTGKFRPTILKSTCLLYGHYLALKMALAACAIPYEEHPPIRWQKTFNLSPREKGETDNAWKKRLRARAQQLFPQVEIPLQAADAVLLAEYARRSHQGAFHARAKK